MLVTARFHLRCIQNHASAMSLYAHAQSSYKYLSVQQGKALRVSRSSTNSHVCSSTSTTWSLADSTSTVMYMLINSVDTCTQQCGVAAALASHEMCAKNNWSDVHLLAVGRICCPRVNTALLFFSFADSSLASALVESTCSAVRTGLPSR